MRKLVQVIIAIGMIMGLISQVVAMPTSITVDSYLNGCYTYNQCDYGYGSHVLSQSFGAGKYTFTVDPASGAWSSYNSPDTSSQWLDRHWFWSLYIYNPQTKILYGDPGPSIGSNNDFISGASALAQFNLSNDHVTIDMGSGGSLLFYIKDRAPRDNIGTVIVNITEVPKITWTGAINRDASNPGNWLGGVVPANGDNVVFGNSSSVNCIWDINPSLSSFSIYPGYSGTVTLNSDLTMTGDIRIEAGTLDARSRTITVGGNWIYVNGTNTPLGDTDGNGYVDGNDVSAMLLMIFDPGTVTQCTDMNFDGSVNILDVVSALRASNGSDGLRYCTGGLFKPGMSTVVLDGINQTISGDTVFYNLEKTAACPGDTLKFEAGSLQTILGRLTLKGSEGCLLALRSTQDGQPWYIDPQGTRNVSFASIKDMHNISFIDILTTQSHDDGGNSPGVRFGGTQCVCLDEKLILAKVFCIEGNCNE